MRHPLDMHALFCEAGVVISRHHINEIIFTENTCIEYGIIFTGDPPP